MSGGVTWTWEGALNEIVRLQGRIAALEEENAHFRAAVLDPEEDTPQRNADTALEAMFDSVLIAAREAAAQVCDERARAHQKTLNESPHCDRDGVRAKRDEAEKCAAAIRRGAPPAPDPTKAIDEADAQAGRRRAARRRR